VRLLLDTHALLWAAGNPDELATPARKAIEDSRNEVFVSAAVAWEITIKYALGKLELPAAPASWFPARVHSMGFQELAITAGHGLAVSALPDIHKDPFDRIMIAQAQLEGLAFVTRDPENHKYAVQLLKA
jgi:PIN domain nuclease of toxin-antitoxin system